MLGLASIHQSNKDATGGYVLTQIREKLADLPTVIQRSLDELLAFLGRKSE